MPLPDTHRSGARFFKCALQVNPFAYLVTNARQTPYTDEASYNAAMVQACLDTHIEVVGLTDHHRVRDSLGLQAALTDAGVTVLPGFEAIASDGVHVLVLFEEGTGEDEINRRIGEMDVAFDDGNSDLGAIDTVALLSKAHDWGAVMIPSHVEREDGLLTRLQGQVRTRAWGSDDLMAVGVTQRIEDIDESVRLILEGTPQEYRRAHPPAIVAAKDVYGPDDFAITGTWTWIKMTTPSLDGLRQAFLDPDSRIAEPGDDVDPGGTRFTSISWEGGFLDGERIDLNPRFNVLIGGRGTGKSTVIESVRFVLDLPPWGDQSRSGFLERVLRPGTKVTLGVQCCSPTVEYFRVSRSVGSSATIHNTAGEVVPQTPSELLGHPQIFGQRDLALLADDAKGRDRLLRPFMQPDPAADRRQMELRTALVRNREQLLELRTNRMALEARAERIPAVEAQIDRLRRAGLDERLERKDRLAADTRTLKRAAAELEEAEGAWGRVVQAVPTDLAYLSAAARADAQAADLLEEAEGVMTKLRTAITSPSAAIQQAVDDARDAMAQLLQNAAERETAAEEDHQQALRDLQRDGVDASAYVALGSELDELRQAAARLAHLDEAIAAARATRDELLAERARVLAGIADRKKKAAKRMRGKLDHRADIRSRPGSDRTALTALILGIDGRTDKVVAAIETAQTIDVVELAAAFRSGPDAVRSLLPDVTENQAERVAGCDEDRLLQIEEVVPEDHVEVHLNLAPPGEAPVWQVVEDLSTGQKATAMLLLILAEGEDPLLIDQPEDDLDNQFVSESLVPLIRRAKGERQLLFSTHNANIPVLGDAELVLVMSADGSASSDGHGRVLPDGRGSIDDAAARRHIERILEGGREAFERRGRRYGY